MSWHNKLVSWYNGECNTHNGVCKMQAVVHLEIAEDGSLALGQPPQNVDASCLAVCHEVIGQTVAMTSICWILRTIVALG